MGLSIRKTSSLQAEAVHPKTLINMIFSSKQHPSTLISYNFRSWLPVSAYRNRADDGHTCLKHF